jgi:hypothetical protein
MSRTRGVDSGEAMNYAGAHTREVFARAISRNRAITSDSVNNLWHNMIR